MSQLENMIMQKTDYTLPDSLGIIMTFKYDDVFNPLEVLPEMTCDIGTKKGELELDKRKPCTRLF